jgi:hypothetical protein
VRLDHVSYAVDPGGFSSTVQRLGSALGASFSDGGVHPRFGTRNFVLALAGDTYIEVVTTLDHPAADRAPFAQAVKYRAGAGGGWLGWVVSVDDISPIADRIGRAAIDGHRVRPDGYDLRWKQIGVLDLIHDPQLPFFVQWLVEPAQRPSANASGAVRARISCLEIAGDPATVSAWLGEPDTHPLDEIEVRWVPGEPGVTAVHFATTHGSVRID